MNTLTILGGSSAGVGTGEGCSSYLVTIDDETNVVLDIGPDTLLELRKHADYRTLDGIVISHLHLDHVLDLFALKFMLSYNPVKAPGKIPLFLPPGGLEFMAKAAELFLTSQDNLDTYFTDVYEMEEYNPTTSLKIGKATITFAPTVHLVPCWAIRVQPPAGGDCVYTADAGSDSDLDTFARDAKVIAADSAAAPNAPEAVKRGVHMDAVAAGQLAQRAATSQLVLTHQWEELLPHQNAAIAADYFRGTIIVASPGVEVTW